MLSPVGYGFADNCATNSWSDKVLTLTPPAGTTMIRLRFSFDGAIQSGSLSSTAGGFAGIVGDCPEDVGEECDPGTGSKASRCDHVHAHGLRDESGHDISRLRRLLTNNSGGDLTAGAVVVLDGSGFTTTSTAASAVGMVGILLDDTTDGSDGRVQFISPQTASAIPAGVTGASADDYLFTSSTPGEATADATRAAGAFGRVLAVDGSGVPTLVELWGVPDGSGAGGGGITLGSLTPSGTPVTVFDASSGNHYYGFPSMVRTADGWYHVFSAKFNDHTDTTHNGSGVHKSASTVAGLTAATEVEDVAAPNPGTRGAGGRTVTMLPDGRAASVYGTYDGTNTLTGRPIYTSVGTWDGSAWTWASGAQVTGHGFTTYVVQSGADTDPARRDLAHAGLWP